MFLDDRKSQVFPTLTPVQLQFALNFASGPARRFSPGKRSLMWATPTRRSGWSSRAVWSQPATMGWDENRPSRRTDRANSAGRLVRARRRRNAQLLSSRSSLNRSSAVRGDSTELTPNLHQGVCEAYTKCMIGDKISRKINGRGDRI